MILIDSNIFMYVVGAPHPHKDPSRDFLLRVTRGESDGAIDAEVLQEILHRYRSMGRWDIAAQAYDLARRSVPNVLPVTASTMDAARNLMEKYRDIPARDAVHAAVAREAGLKEICSYDTHFDQIEGLRRIEPS